MFARGLFGEFCQTLTRKNKYPANIIHVPRQVRQLTRPKLTANINAREHGFVSKNANINPREHNEFTVFNTQN